MELTNRLLRVVEYAFRNSSSQQRLKGYDCWKELIDNASLDMKHMCSPKQIKLLVTPLKAKFSKQEIVICKRFDVFAYLLEKLQHKAVLCLTEFLEFCFGPIGDNTHASKVGQGKTVPQIWTKSTKVLVDIIGHSHGKSVSCLTTEDVIKLESPVINHTNISGYYKVIINSVGECCSLLKEVDIESKRETVIKCMWRSVFNLVIPTSDNMRIKYFQVISEVLDNYVTQSRENPYFEDLLILIISVLLSYGKDFVYEVIQYNLKQLLTIIFITDNFPADVADNFKAVVSHAFSKMLKVETKLRVIKDIMSCFMKTTPNDENICHINKIWLCVANELISDFSAQIIEEFGEFNSFLMWPAFHLHHLDDAAKKLTVLYWMKLYRKISLDNEERKQTVMKELEKIFKNNPLLSSDVVSLLNVMSQFETKFTKEFVIKLMSVSSQILLLPNLKTEDEQKITALVMQYFEPSLECYKCEQNEEAIKNICNCIEHILCLHKGYKLLDTLATFMKNSPDDLRAKFSQNLSNLLLDLYNKESDVTGYNAKELHKVIQVLSSTSPSKETTTPFIAPSGRSARIANLAKSSPKSPRSKAKKIEPSPTALRLFGKDLDTLSPLHVKGSQLNNSSPSRARKVVNSARSKPKTPPSIHDEKSSDFVPIDTEVKFQPEKLSKHQREVLKKRREDIPALYQDLSQSTSQDMFTSSSSSQSMDKPDKENTADNKKVIVEVIGHHFQKEESPKVSYFPIPSQHVQEVTVPRKEVETHEDILVSETNKVEDPEETLCEPPDKIIEKSPSEDGTAEDLAKENEKQSPDTVLETKGSTCDKLDEKERKRRMKIEAELQKLKMDIVGADEFFAASRRTRTREKPKKLEGGANPRSSSKEEQHSRMSLGEAKLDTKAEKNRRKTIGTVKDLKTDHNETSSVQEKTQPDTPKTSRRRSLKVKGVTTEEQKKLEEDKNEALTVVASKETELKTLESKDVKASDYQDVEEKRGQKRKYSSCDEESEDIIESSQESRGDVTPIFTSPKRKSLVSTSLEENLDNSEEKTLVQQKTITLKDFVSDPDPEEVVEDDRVKNDIVTEDNNTKETIGEKMIVEDKEDNVKECDIVAESEVNEEVPVHFEEVGQEVEISDIEEIIGVNISGTGGKEDNEGEIPVAVNTTQDTTITQETTNEFSNMEDLSQNDTQDLETQDTETQSTTAHDTQTQDIPTQSSEDTRTPVLYFDLPKKPELTESERIMCRMDTISICSDPQFLNFGKDQIGNNQGLEEMEIKATGQSDAKEDMLQMEDVLASPCAQQINNLPSSPITVETPNRTTELLNNTLDISPINSKSSSTDSAEEISSSSVSRNFKAEMEELERFEKDNQAEIISESTPESSDPMVEISKQPKYMDDNPNEGLPNTVEDLVNILEGNPMKQVKQISCEIELIKVPPQLEPPQQKDKVVHRHFSDETIPLQMPDAEVLHSGEENQLAEVKEEPTEEVQQSEGLAEQMEDFPNQVEVIRRLKENNVMQERSSKLLNMINISSPATHKMFLKKRSGGPSVSPSSGRIKRLMLGISPKQNMEDLIGEVKEEDILTFSREVPSPLAVPRGSILKRKLSDTSDEGVSPCPKRKRVNFSDPCLTSKKVFIKDDYRDIFLEPNCLFPSTPEAKPKEAHPKHMQESPEFGGGFEKMTESENIETEPSLEVTNPLILRKDKPIYPKLVDCTEDVLVILKRVTSPMFINTLMNKLKNKDIKTIGDLARQSEAEINRFPFKVPVVANVYRALDNYYKKNVDKGGKDGVESGESSTNVDDAAKDHTPKKSLPVIVDVRAQFKELLERSKAEGTADDLTKILLTSLEKQQLIPLIKSHFSVETDFLEEKDFKFIIKHITSTVGLPTIFEILTESVETSENESVYFDCMIKHSIDKRPLVDLLENRSLTEVRMCLEESLKKNIFDKEDLKTCLLPLIESPSDISSYLNRISVVQLGEIIISRLEFSDIKQFFSQIIEAHRSKNIVTTLTGELFKHVQSTTEIVNSFKNCISVQNEEQQKEIMVEMFKFISGRLDLNTLLELHVDFLKRIPSIAAGSKEK